MHIFLLRGYIAETLLSDLLNYWLSQTPIKNQPQWWSVQWNLIFWNDCLKKKIVIDSNGSIKFRNQKKLQDNYLYFYLILCVLEHRFLNIDIIFTNFIFLIQIRFFHWKYSIQRRDYISSSTKINNNNKIKIYIVPLFSQNFYFTNILRDLWKEFASMCRLKILICFLYMCVTHFVSFKKYIIEGFLFINLIWI